MQHNSLRLHPASICHRSRQSFAQCPLRQSWQIQSITARGHKGRSASQTDTGPDAGVKVNNHRSNSFLKASPRVWRNPKSPWDAALLGNTLGHFCFPRVFRDTLGRRFAPKTFPEPHTSRRSLTNIRFPRIKKAPPFPFREMAVPYCITAGTVSCSFSQLSYKPF